MNHKTRFNIIIAGAGAAGLTLLWYLMKSDSLNNKRILVLDKSFSQENNKTWCFWDSHNLAVDEFIYHTWQELEVGVLGELFSEKLKNFTYQCIRNGDYSGHIQKQASTFKNITFLEADILSFTSAGELGIVETGKGTFTSPFIFQSALTPPGLKSIKADISLLQHFIGWEIETDRELFNPDKAVLMDFNVPQQKGLTFLYILPFSKTRALVEYTLFSKNICAENIYEEGIMKYLKERFGLDRGQYSIKRKEKGVIPMEDRQCKAWYCNRVMNIGLVGGFTKPTTGFTFTRIHRRCKDIVTALEAGQNLPDEQVSSYRFRVYDMMLLYLLSTDQDTSIRIFHDLFKKNSFDSILQFLEEKTSPLQEISIFATMPYVPFFKSIYKMKHRIFSDA